MSKVDTLEQNDNYIVQQKQVINIFENCIFEDIGKLPAFYENDSRVIIYEDYPEDEMAKQYYDYRIIVKNSDIQIEYWVYNNICRLQHIEINGDTDISKWGGHLGMKKEDVLSFFGTPKASANAELHYFSDDSKYSVHFWFKNNIVIRITLAGSL